MSAVFTDLMWGRPSDVIVDALWEYTLAEPGKDAPVLSSQAHDKAWGRRDCVSVKLSTNFYGETLARIIECETVPLVLVGSLRRGDRFRTYSGREHEFSHAHNGTCWTRPPVECFGACAAVEVLK